MQKNIAVFVGSLRRESLNRKLAHALVQLASGDLKFEFFEIGGLPLYNQDLDESPPSQWTEIRAKLKNADGILFVTPEYNRSVPGVLKNAIDVCSRPHGQSVWGGKPAAVISASPGMVGGFGANHHLRQMLVFLNVPCLQQPEAYIGNAGALFNAEGEIAKDATRDFLKTFMASFFEWVGMFSEKRGHKVAA